jgi:murein DD-endopeptidase MepM/ murein hydrolase activator NlpD
MSGTKKWTSTGHDSNAEEIDLSTIYEFLRCTKRANASGQEPAQDSHWLRTPKIEKPVSALCGFSRMHGDASPEIQDRIIDLLLEVGARYKLPYRDIAHLLLICKVESGFNPDAAALSNSAAGLGQYTDAMIKATSNASLSKARLSFALDLRAESVFDAERGTYALLLSYMRSKELAIANFGKEYENKLYLFHREGWSFNPTSEHLARSRLRELVQIIDSQILPFVSQLEKLLAANSQLSFKLITKDGQPCGNQPFLAVFPSKPSAVGLLPKVQGTARRAEFKFGTTDAMGCTQPICTPGLSEIVFLVLNRQYKELLSVAGCTGGQTGAEPDESMSSKIASDAAVTTTGLQKITHITNGAQVQLARTVQPHNGDYLGRHPLMGLVTTYLTEALNMKESAATAVVEHKRSHIVLPAASRAQRFGDYQSMVAIRTGVSLREIFDREKTAEVPHETVQANIKKQVEVASAGTGMVLQEGLLFPMACRPAESYRTGSRAFNSSRGNRRHAGCDLYAAVGTEIRAMADGVIVRCYPFYWKTDAIDVVHGNFVVRYGELAPRNEEEQKALAGLQIKRGDVIGKIGQLFEKEGVKHKHTMLHLEMYSTNVRPEKKEDQLSQPKSSPFERRHDLVDPSDTLDICKLS